jgi:hypothetical protein
MKGTGVVIEAIEYVSFKHKETIMQQMRRKIGKGLRMSFTDNLIICEYKAQIN